MAFRSKVAEQAARGPLAATRSNAPRSVSRLEPQGYFGWSRDPAVALLTVLPLWIVYELLRLSLAPEERNGAEALITESLRGFGPRALLVLEVVLGAVFLVATISILRRRVPWVRVALVTAIEGAVYGLMLGPVTQVLTLFLLDGGRILQVALPPGLAVDLVGSLGAGLFEEAVFRLGLLSLLALVLHRAASAVGLPVAVGSGAAIVASAVAFALFHHVGAGGEPFVRGVFAFRTIAGIVLGLLFVLRGFGVVVYCHAVYDVHFYLTHDVHD